MPERARRYPGLLVRVVVALTVALVVGGIGQFSGLAQEDGGAFDPAGFDLGLELVVDGLDQPLYATSASDSDERGRLFIVEKPGRIQVLQDGALTPDPFLDITDRVGSDGSEQGLLSVAFHPGYAANGAFYVNYTDRDGDTVVSRFTVSADNPDRADPASEAVLLNVDQPYPNHNGGLVLFGPDGAFYIGLGDGGSGGDPEGNAQNLGTLLGSVLRLEVDPAAPADGALYANPDDNPFLTTEGALPEIWAYGQRNPWRFSFDRETGDFYLADVGQNAYEEVHFRPAAELGGENYGWPITEGLHCFPESVECSTEGLIAPVAEYSRDSGCSITGGYVYRGANVPALTGVYLFADYCSGLLWGLGRDVSGTRLLSNPIQTGLNISSFGEDAAGEVYVIDLNGGVYRIEAAL
ncbi:MAG: PQQ-dependent sugar dehydrogenase [Chloroflexota bacterium]|nr:PQQ-dependent sugar dehydrogenase [Chloroflexota bacterium]